MGFRVGAVVSLVWMLCIGIGGAQASEGAAQDSSQPPSHTWWDRSLDKPAPPRPENLHWDAWPYRARVLSAQYEDKYTFLHRRVYTKDTWIWGYIAPFAERFHMPEKWIEPELDGVLGVAFRMMFPLTVQCGFGGDPKTCSAPPRCQMDVYYDATIDLPWVHKDQMRDNLMEGMHSGMFLQDPEYQFRSTNQYYRKRPGPDETPQLGPLAGPVTFQLGDQKTIGTVAHFDREYMPGVGLISWFGLCPSTPNPRTATLTFADANGTPQHVMSFPGSWLQRAHKDWMAHKDEQNAPLLISVLEKVDKIPPSPWQKVTTWVADHNPFAEPKPTPPPIDSRTYEQNFVHGDGKNPFTADPFTWVYTRAFAERFHMPEKWIDPNLKGALALAFRMVDLNTFDCGYGGSADSCWPRTTCQMDMYYDTAIDLPWNKPFLRDNKKPTLHSGWFLHSQTFRSWGVNRYIYGQDDLDDEDYSKASASYAINPGGLFLYDRAYRPGIGLMSVLGVCPKSENPFPIMFRAEPEWSHYLDGKLKKKDVPIVHQFVYPKEFRQRTKIVHDVGGRPVQQTIRGLVRGFFDKRKGSAAQD